MEDDLRYERKGFVSAKISNSKNDQDDEKRGASPGTRVAAMQWNTVHRRKVPGVG